MAVFCKIKSHFKFLHQIVSIKYYFSIYYLLCGAFCCVYTALKRTL